MTDEFTAANYISYLLILKAAVGDIAKRLDVFADELRASHPDIMKYLTRQERIELSGNQQ